MKITTYILTHNSPRQLLEVLRSLHTADKGFLFDGHVIVVDQSTIPEKQKDNQKLCDMWEVHRVAHENLGASGGRWFCATHFKESDSDLMYFFEDDLLINSEPHVRCRFGFPNIVRNIYQTSQAILAREQLDYLKLTFHEVFCDHSRNWVTNQPSVFDKLAYENGIAFLVGDIYYSNWPMLIRQSASASIFHGLAMTEGKVASRANEMISTKQLRVGVLAAWPIRHVRIEDRPDRKDL